ncbi:MAG: aldo/keto reductase [Clostridiales bacterium]|nr:aldo/keto reductase [Clostridiales bacterium]MDY4200414.1 aldo/keto reductase [Candidatus Fimadaptatus sp.]
MEYRNFPGTDVNASLLGIGCMRLPTNEDGSINEPEAIALIRYAIDHGVTYVDTAYGYHGGMSEVLVGKALRDGYREKVTLTSKLPVWLVKTYDDMERLLDEQLGRLQTDHLDFYLLHALNQKSFHDIQALDYKKFMNDMLRKGKIRYPGFSFHDNAEVFREILNDFDWKLAQVQMNVLDEFNQATLDGIKLAEKKGVGIVIMEPLRGGMLAKNPPENVAEVYAKLGGNRTHIDWCFRWLYDQPGAKVILSGMSNEAQLKDNINIFANTSANCLTDSERAGLTEVRKAYESRVRVGCTGCRYCADCPREVHIDRIFRELDSCTMFDDMERYGKVYAKLVAEKHDGSMCVKCGKCESACPQKFPIRKLLEEIDSEFHAKA